MASLTTSSAVAIVGSTVELTLTNTVKTIRRSRCHTDPTGNDTNAVQAAPATTPSLTSTSVTNNSTVAGTPPPSSVATNTAGTKYLVYNGHLLNNSSHISLRGDNR